MSDEVIPPGSALRLATLDDVPALKTLVAASARGLNDKAYTTEQVELALQSAYGVDTQLIRDQTYYVVEEQGKLVACGGWSFRATLYGGDAQAGRSSNPLDPAHEPARIRSFFVDPAVARRGLATQILERCELEAATRGFRSAALLATLPGLKLYKKRGYVAEKPREYPLGEHSSARGKTITFVPMRKVLPAPTTPPA